MADTHPSLSSSSGIVPSHSDQMIHSIAASKCPVCDNLSPYRRVHDAVELPIPYQPLVADIMSAAQNACPICSLVWAALDAAERSFNEKKQPLNALMRPDDRVKLFYLPISTRRNGSQSLVSQYKLPGKTPFDYGSMAVTFESPSLATQVKLELYTLQDPNDFPPLRNHVLLPGTLDLEYTILLVKKWIEECESHGIECRVPQKPLLPTRVLDLGQQDGSQGVKLLVTDDQAAPYVALSYCWGEAAEMITTTSENLSSMELDLEWDRIPLTFRDAIAFTRALGIQYLWIDALCILQDDVNDWEKESANMAQIYSQSYLTIAATSGSDCFQGLFQSRWTRTPTESYRKSDQGQKISIVSHEIGSLHDGSKVYSRPSLHLAHDRFIEIDNADMHRTDAPLLCRAWAFQERLLPSRTLHFHAEELVWECNTGISCECRKLRCKRRNDSHPAQSSRWLKQWLSSVAKHQSETADVGYVWLDVVSEFAKLHLTKEEDRMPALSGLADQFSGAKLGRYVGGIWENDLARSLLYQRVVVYPKNKLPKSVEACTNECQRNVPQTASPTWSWTSISMSETVGVSFDKVLGKNFEQDSYFQARILTYRVHGNNPLSWVTDGILEARGLMASGRLLQTDQYELEIEINDALHSRYTITQGFWNDERVELGSGSLVYLLLVGKVSLSYDLDTMKHQMRHDERCILVIQKLDEQTDCYRRIGMIHAPSTDDWFLDATIETLKLL